MSETASVANPVPGQVIDYTISVQNVGTTSATSSTLADTLPAGMTLLGASTDTGSVTAAGGTVSGNLGTISAGTTATVHVFAAVDTGTSGLLTNNVSVSSPDDTNSANNSASASVNAGAATASAANLAVSASGLPATLTVGQQATLLLTVTNNSSTNSASNVQLMGMLPSSVSILSATASGTGTVTQNGSLLTANLGALAPGATATVSIVGLALAPGSLNETAVATTDAGDSNTADNSATASATISAAGSGAADLQVTKTGPATGTVGESVTYSISVSNLSTTNTATAAQLTDVLPSGLALVSATSSLGSVSSSGGIITANLGDLAPGASGTLTVVALPTVAGPISNKVSASTSAGDSNMSNNFSTANTTIAAGGSGAADLAVTKTAAATGKVGSDLTYTITVTNLSGSNTATAATLTDALPSGLTFVSATSSVGSVSNSTGVVTANLGDLAPGASATITLVGLPNAAGSLTNTAVASTSAGDSNGSNNVASVSTNISAAGNGAADLAVTKTAAATGTVGANLTYTITVTNLSSSNTATAAVLTDPLPVGLTFVSATSSVGTASNSGGVITANLGNMAPGASATITVVATPTAAMSLKNTAIASTTAGDVDLSNNTASATTTISAAAQANVSITKIASPDPDTVGQNLTYTITVQNSGGADAAGTVVTDVLPAGVTFVSSSSSAGSVSNSGGTVTANLGALAAGATDTITIVVTPNAAGTLVNTASVTTTSTNSSQNTTATVSSTVNAAGGGGGTGGSNCYLAGQAGDGTDARFVSNLYRELLGRDPDSGGQAFWVNYLNHNGQANHLNNPRRLQVIDSFIASQEYQEHLVTCMYEHFLNRAPDVGGLQFFVTQLAHGVDEKIVLSEIVGSQEYFIINGDTNAGFVNALYRDLLGRGADPGGAAYWANLAAQAGPSHDNLVRAMLGSPEAEHDLLLNASSSGLSQVTGGGWENLYFQGNVPNAGAANDVFYQKLHANTPWDDVIENMLESNHYYDASKSV